MRNVLFGVVLAVAAASAGCKKADHSAAKAEEQFATLTVDEVAAQLEAKQIVPVDCNGDGTRKQMGVVPGAVLVTDEEQYGPSELPADKTTKLVFYCSKET
ncbi:MAG TPA: hypothetical protein VMZ53_10210 [Kofleriaceae bacterium]|nr:hypothetical protein [Kofleriaceae bacterium]